MGVMANTIQIQANIVWNVIRTGSGVLVGVCDPLGLTVEADDESELQSVIGEAHHCLFLDLFEEGELESFLRDHGWRTVGPVPAGLPEGVKFDVPFKVVPAHDRA
jgi:hypothetical protein